MTASLHFPNLPSDWVEKENQIDPSQFARIYHRADLAGRPKLRVLFLIHGFGEHSGRYLHFPHFLQNSIDVMIAPDLPGHGNSKGNRGHFESVEDLHEAIDLTLTSGMKWLKTQNSEIEIHAFGHSFGGLLLAHSCLVTKSLRRHTLRTVSLSSPFLGFGFPVPELKKRVGLLVEPFLGWLPMKSEVDADDLSHDPSVIEAYKKDPLNHSWITPRTFIHMNTMMDEVQESRLDFPCPWALFLPTHDPIAKVETSRSFFEKHSRKKEIPGRLFELSEFLHEGFNEVGKEVAFEKLALWLA